MLVHVLSCLCCVLCLALSVGAADRGERRGRWEVGPISQWCAGTVVGEGGSGHGCIVAAVVGASARKRCRARASGARTSERGEGRHEIFSWRRAGCKSARRGAALKALRWVRVQRIKIESSDDFSFQNRF